MQLDHLFRLVACAWPITRKNYPVIPKNVWEIEVRHFAMKHILLHLVKAVGTLAAAIEPLDHGQLLNQAELIIALRKYLLDIIKLALVADISPDMLELEIRKFAEEHQIQEDEWQPLGSHGLPEV